MPIELHPAAKEAFDRKALEVAARLEPLPDTQRGQKANESSFSHRPTVPVDYSSVTGLFMTRSSFDDLGNEVARYVHRPEGSIGLRGDAFTQFKELVLRLSASLNFAIRSVRSSSKGSLLSG